MSDNPQPSGINANAGGDFSGRDFAGRDLINNNSSTTIFQNPSKTTSAELPARQPFFGRKEQLAQIAAALEPEARGWGVLIDGPGGIGKTALALEAAHTAAGFQSKIFLSAKIRELTPQGEKQLEDFMLPNYIELLADLARALGEPEINKSNPNERAKLVREALSQKKALLVIDNVETFAEAERDRLYQFLDRLPASCKAIVTSRRRANIFAQVIRLDKLEKDEAAQLLAALAEKLPRLKQTSEKERTELYEASGGNPLLLTWLAGQLGRPRSECRDVPAAIAYLKAAPPNNDPLEYIFGDLVETFTENEVAVLAALTLFTQPAKTRWVAETADLTEQAAKLALEDLTDRALVVADDNFEKYFLPRLAAEFLRRKKPEVIARAGNNLTDQVFALAQESGWEEYELFPNLDAEWERVVTALPLSMQGENRRLQTLCEALDSFMNFTGRWDELLVLHQQAEEKAVAANDFGNAGWRAYRAGYMYSLRGQSAEVLNCATHAAAHWEQAEAGARERAFAIRLHGLGHQLANDYVAAIAAYREALTLWRTLSPESDDVAIALNDLAGVEQSSGDYDAAERDYGEALRIVKKVNYQENVAVYTGNLADLALDREQWAKAETLAREALPLAEKVGRLQLVASNCRRIAKALTRQGQPVAGLPYAQRAVAIFTKLRSPDLAGAQEVLKECEKGAARA